MLFKKSILSVSLGLALFGLQSVTAHADAAKPYAGQTINVLLPPWGTLSKAMVDKFKADTGISVSMQTLGWDEIRAKIVTSMVSGNAPADVTEVDWSWVGQFGAAKWYAPLDGKIDPKVVADIASTKIFTFHGKTIAIPYNNDFRLLIVNKAHFDKAGIKVMPKTMDQLLAAARAIKKANISSAPIALPLSASEGTATAWYLLTKAYGGNLFTNDFKPLFKDKNSPGYKALAFEISALKEGLIDPASTGLTDVQVQETFKAGKASIDLAGWAGNLAVYNDASKSKVAGSVVGAVMPNVKGVSKSIGLPEALGVPANAAHKEAAFAFINWWMKPENQVQVYNELSDLPTRATVLQKLTNDGKLVSGLALVEQYKGVEPLFPQGTPNWYPELSRAASSAINQAAKGQLTVDQAVAQIADQVTQAMKQ